MVDLPVDHLGLTATRIAVGSAVGHTICVAMMVGSGHSEPAPASHTEQIHQNADSKESEEQVSETSLPSESDSTQDDNQTTTVPTLDRSNTFTYSYSKESEGSSSADPTKERQSSTKPQKTLSKKSRSNVCQRRHCNVTERCRTI